MTRLLSAEALKLRSTRTSWLLALAALVLATGIAAAVAASGDPGPSAFADATSPGGIALTIALILGSLALTTEHRHGTITSTLLVTPARGRVVGAKLAVTGGVGAALGLLAAGTVVVVVVTVLQSRGIATGTDAGDHLRIVLGTGLAGALFAAIGVGVGALVRNQVGAVIGALVWLYVVEQLLRVVPGVGDAMAQYGLVGLSAAASGTTGPDPTVDLPSQGVALAGLGLWAAVLVTAGVVVTRRRDVG